MTTEFVFWDVQHGNAAYIRTPNGQHIAADLGTGKLGDGASTFSPLLHLRDSWDVSQLDSVIISHPHRDHIDDIFNFDALSPLTLSRPGHLSESDIRSDNKGAKSDRFIDKYLQIGRRYNQPCPPFLNPHEPSNNGGVEIQTFEPSSCPTSNLNNHSMVTMVTYEGCKMLIPGDNESLSREELLGRRDFRDAIQGTDVLLAPHHGRKAGFSEALFEYITPHLTIISDGPSGDTSATDLYAGKTKGWKVHKRSGGSETRRCVTTRKDGMIVVDFGRNQSGTPCIAVRVD